MNEERALDVLSALAQPTRLAIFRFLVQNGPRGIAALEIGRQLNVVPSTLSGHLSVLKRSGALTAKRHQKEIHYAANLTAMNNLIGFLLTDCCSGQINNCSDIMILLNLDDVTSQDAALR